ncbi:MAG: FAD:protein FMN transferase [Oscillospiraceae bacterium]|nr:FAD:protein FMN transferase [Oscillospiraceae bacterium]
MKKILSLLLSVLMLMGVSGCAQNEPLPEEPQKNSYSARYYDYFDTESLIIGYEESQEDFDAVCAVIKEELEHYHQLYDIYHWYDGINNVYTVNRDAGTAPVEVHEDIIALFEFCREMYDLTGGKTNFAMGRVLSLWHECREDYNYSPLSVELPTDEELSVAASHMNIDDIVIDKENNTIFFKDPGLKVDVGAIGKGYATEMVARKLEEMGVDNYTLSIGGNIRTIGGKADGSKWVAGITNPDRTSEEPFLLKVQFESLALVTSGSYQRYFYYDNVKYHHIIDPETLYPKDTFTSVSILTPDSGLADAVSTACFNLTLEEGMALIESLENTEAMWVEPDGTEHYSSGFLDFLYEE